MIFDLRKLRNEIYNLDLFNTSSDLFIIIIIMNAYKKKKYNIIKYILKINNNFITKMIIEHLRNVEQDKQKNINIIIRNKYNNRRNQINKKFKRDINKMQCYVYNEINYINRNCFKRRNKFKNKNINNKIEDLKNIERTRELKNRLKNSKLFKKKRRE